MLIVSVSSDVGVRPTYAAFVFCITENVKFFVFSVYDSGR
jgi:hypothetical protein